MSLKGPDRVLGPVGNPWSPDGPLGRSCGYRRAYSWQLRFRGARPGAVLLEWEFGRAAPMSITSGFSVPAPGSGGSCPACAQTWVPAREVLIADSALAGGSVRRALKSRPIVGSEPIRPRLPAGCGAALHPRQHPRQWPRTAQATRLPGSCRAKGLRRAAAGRNNTGRRRPPRP